VFFSVDGWFVGGCFFFPLVVRWLDRVIGPWTLALVIFAFHSFVFPPSWIVAVVIVAVYGVFAYIFFLNW